MSTPDHPDHPHSTPQLGHAVLAAHDAPPAPTPPDADDADDIPSSDSRAELSQIVASACGSDSDPAFFDWWSQVLIFNGQVASLLLHDQVWDGDGQYIDTATMDSRRLVNGKKIDSVISVADNLTLQHGSIVYFAVEKAQVPHPQLLPLLDTVARQPSLIAVRLFKVNTGTDDACRGGAPHPGARRQPL